MGKRGGEWYARIFLWLAPERRVARRAPARGAVHGMRTRRMRRARTSPRVGGELALGPFRRAAFTEAFSF
eukprot:3273222-Pleurochrysis_carterae.AAC.1